MPNNSNPWKCDVAGFPIVGTFSAELGGRTLRIEVARGWWGRARGLLGRSGLPPGHGLLLNPCRAIHTLGMRFAIDVVFLDATGRVVRVCRDVPPGRWMVRGGRDAVATLELAAGQAEMEWVGGRIGSPVG